MIYYTEEQLRELGEYTWVRFPQLVPPGPTSAALTILRQIRHMTNPVQDLYQKASSCITASVPFFKVLYLAPLEDLPTYMFHNSPGVAVVAQWRLRIGK